MRSLVRYALSHGGEDSRIMFPKSIIGRRYAASNPSCTVFGGELLFNTRLVDYRKVLQTNEMSFIGVNMNQTCLMHNYGFDSRNILFKLDGVGLSWMSETDYGNNPGSYYKGLEDCRLVVWDGVLYAYGTRWDTGRKNNARICIYRLGDDLQPIKETVIESPFGASMEKNWAAIENEPFTFVYKYDPMVIVKVTDLDTGSCEIVKSEEKSVTSNTDLNVRGSSQLVELVDGKKVSLVHTADMTTSENGLVEMRYRSAFVLTDANCNILKISDWFVFRTDMSEFCCGIAVHNGYVIIPYSQCDCTVNVLKMSVESVVSFINGDDEGSELYGFDYIFSLAKQYELAEQFASSTVLYNYAATISEPYTDERTFCLAKAFNGLADEFDDLVDPSFVYRIQTIVMKTIVDNGCGKQLYRVLSRIARFYGDLAASEKYSEIADKQCDCFEMC